jgi:hypothetical protein
MRRPFQARARLRRRGPAGPTSPSSSPTTSAGTAWASPAIHYPHGDGKPDRHQAELYNLAEDPGETRNLIDDPAHSQSSPS